MSIPFVDLKTQYQSISVEIGTVIQNVINETAFIRGKYVQDFEEQYADVCSVMHCITCANGTDAIYLVLKALGIGPGDEVITVANSWISASETISQAGAQVVFIDIEPDHFTIDPEKIKEKISRRTKAIIPVHLYGQPADMDAIMAIAEKHSLHVVEDCAQAHLAEYNGQKVGTFGIAGTFSFYPAKNLGAYGDAGAVITNDSDLAERVRRLANHGALNKHDHEFEGMNSRLDGMQAAILSTKLPYLSKWNEQRHENALLYNELLANVEEIINPSIHSDCKHVFHLYVIRTRKRDSLRDFLSEQGVSSGIHYPTALPFLKAYEYLGHQPGDFPVAYRYQSEILSLPMYPELSKSQIEYVVDNIEQFMIN